MDNATADFNITSGVALPDFNITSGVTRLCRHNYCIEVQLYQKILGSIIFVIVWPFIVLDYKRFPIGRPAAAMLGGTLMVITTVVPQDQVFAVLGAKGNVQTICLLLGMMFLSYYYEQVGLLNFLTLWIFGKDKPFRHVLWKVCLLTAAFSAVITNDAACVILTPILLKEHMKQNRSRRELSALLLGIATSANIGSAATFFGNPQNAFIAASSENTISLALFFATTLPAAVFGAFFNILLLYLRYFRVLFRPESIKTSEVELDDNNSADITKPNDSSSETMITDVAQEKKEISDFVNESNDEPKEISDYAPSEKGVEPSEERKSFTDKTWQDWVFLSWLIVISVIVIILLAIPPSLMQFNLGLVPVGAAVLTMLINTILRKTDPHHAIFEVDWGVLLMFYGLFIWLQGFENSGFPHQLFELILPYMDLATLQGVLLFTAFVAIGSNIISNVPLVILVVHNLFNFHCGTSFCSGPLTGILLAWVSTIAGNFTLIGSVANLIVAEKGRTVGKYQLSFITYLKFGSMSTLSVMLMALPIVYFTAKFVKI